ncbi:MAG: L-histidine N(alpha)-methyltransferase [Planctomycetota bacterium]|nr:MAG: L-histidine N(alpha)-methyltransferase [Planctomycetota bacterium]
MESSPAVQQRANGTRDAFRQDVLNGLAYSAKRVPSKYLYDKRGSELFDRICQLDEYYLTRCELEIMERFAPEMGQQIGPGVMLVEYGSGSSVKTRYLLDGLPDPVAYVPLDISDEHLHQTARELAPDYQAIEVLPVCADFMQDFKLPTPERKPTHTAVYFPGSTIGNLNPTRSARLLGRICQLCGSGGGLLIGVDLKKDVRRIEAAYNDREGVTAQFTLNLLRRINRELDADFDLEAFSHRAKYNEPRGRVEIGLVSHRDQTVHIGDETFAFAEGEFIHTEYSHKYTIDEFAGLAAGAGLALHRQWTDKGENLAVLHFAVNDAH